MLTLPMARNDNDPMTVNRNSSRHSRIEPLESRTLGGRARGARTDRRGRQYLVRDTTPPYMDR